jgi:CBS domain-containing protein
MKVRELMTTDVRYAASETTLDDVARMMRDEDAGAIPVLDGDDLIGIVTDRDIVVRCIAEGDDPREVTAGEAISGSPRTISPEEDVENALDVMAEEQIRRLPVCEGGHLVGILSLGDIAVKQPEERIAGKALEDVSEGAKASKPGQRKAQAAIRGPETAAVHGGGRQEQIEQGSGRRQGISNRSAGEEKSRQSKVVPFRPEAQSGSTGQRSQTAPSAEEVIKPRTSRAASRRSSASKKTG